MAEVEVGETYKSARARLPSGWDEREGRLWLVSLLAELERAGERPHPVAKDVSRSRPWSRRCALGDRFLSLYARRPRLVQSRVVEWYKGKETGRARVCPVPFLTDASLCHSCREQPRLEALQEKDRRYPLVSRQASVLRVLCYSQVCWHSRMVPEWAVAGQEQGSRCSRTDRTAEAGS